MSESNTITRISTDLSVIPHTGCNKALFFNGMHAINLRQAIDKYIPGQMEIIKGRDNMKKALDEANLSDSTKIPELVPWYVEPDMTGHMLQTRRIAMVITDLDENAFQLAVSQIAKDVDGEFTSRQDAAKNEDPYREDSL